VAAEKRIMDGKKLKLPRWEFIILTVILLTAAFTRLYRIRDYMTFLGDEGRDALVVRDIVRGVHFPLIGPGTSVGNMYLGPLYYYLVAPSLLMSNFSPVGLAVEVALIGILTVALMWWVGRQWFGTTAALAVSFLYAVSPVVITYSRSSWNPNIMPFFALLAMYGTWQIRQTAVWKWLPVVAVSLAFVLNSHYLGLLLLPTIFIYLVLSKNILHSKFYILNSIILFLFLMSPLVLFDMRHNWVNFNALKTFFTDRQGTVNIKAYKAIPNLWPIWSDFVSNLMTAGNLLLGRVVAALLILFIIVKILKKQLNEELLFTVIWLLVGITGLGLYKQHIYVHYYGFLFPAVFLLMGFMLKTFNTRIYTAVLSVIIFGLLLSVELTANPFLSSPNLQLQRTTEIAEFITKEAAGKPFNLALVSRTNYDAGYRYVFKLLNSPYVTIHDQMTDQLYVICENTDCKPVGNPLWEVAAFGWAKIDQKWDFPWQVSVYRLVHNPEGK
jgi:4-amino-4-deoxy-L-arabinose transferase-like glycosyltransferase